MTYDDLNNIKQCIDTCFGYLTDNSCGDPECCGGPYYEYEDFLDARRILFEDYSINIPKVIQGFDR
jgi:hypothetical protein